VTNGPFEAVIFDLGGVVLDSPLDVIAEHEAAAGVPIGSLNTIVHRSGGSGAWARHERGELDLDGFVDAFTSELRTAGVDLDVSELMTAICSAFRVRPVMEQAIVRLRAAGLRVAALTNNWSTFPKGRLPQHFDVFVESVVEGVRKPEPEIYRRCLERLDSPPALTVMLDDLGPNLKPARELGITTIKVVDAESAVAELGSLLDIELFASG
jgi:putative hydrolase of the HAD superfamily